MAVAEAIRLLGNQLHETLILPDRERYPAELQTIEPEKLVERIKVESQYIESSSASGVIFAGLLAGGIALSIIGQNSESFKMLPLQLIPAEVAAGITSLTAAYMRTVAGQKFNYLNQEVLRRLSVN